MADGGPRDTELKMGGKDMRRYTSGLLILFLVMVLGNHRPASLAAAEQGDPLKKSIVKIFAVYKEANYDQPWQMRAQKDGTGSGCIIEGNRILTNAHVVSDQSYIEVIRAGEVKRFTASVEYVAHDSDLALLTVKDEQFFKDAAALSFGVMPSLQDAVSVYGFPLGGDKLSITEGVVSRIEMQGYAHSHMNFLTMQIDAAINSGNSGGPVIKEGKIVGVAFQVDRSGEALGYVIPLPVIHRFMKDIKDGKYDGAPYLGIWVQHTRNDYLRDFLKMTADQTGVMVTEVDYGSSAWGHIRESDVLLSIDSIPIANDATIPFLDDERISMFSLMREHQIDDTITVMLLREGAVVEEKIVLMGWKTLVPRVKYDIRPTYYIYAGLVFTPVCENYLNAWSEWKNVPTLLRYNYYFGDMSEDTHQVVLLSKVLAHQVNRGYHEFSEKVVTHVNGQKIGHIRDVIKMLKAPQGKYHFIKLWGGKLIVLDAKDAQAASQEILDRYGIGDHCSADLK